MSREFYRKCVKQHIILTNGPSLTSQVCAQWSKDYNSRIAFFNTARPYPGLDQHIPIPQTGCQTHGPVCSRNVLGGIIHDYYRDAV
jgi:hypothetical protein